MGDIVSVEPGRKRVVGQEDNQTPDVPKRNNASKTTLHHRINTMKPMTTMMTMTNHAQFSFYLLSSGGKQVCIILMVLTVGKIVALFKASLATGLI